MNKSIQSGTVAASDKRTRRPFVLAALIISMFMAAVEGTIVATAMPDIVGDLGGFSLYSWVFSAFLLMQAVTTLIYGKLSDLFGRKPIYIFGVVIFLIGSVLCGFSTSMLMLIVFRLIQGIGAGAVQPIATTIVGDMYTMEERAKIQGLLSSVWGISAIVGPLAGGLIVHYANWSYIFWINVPLGIAGIIGVILFLHERIEKQDRSIDYPGAGLFFISISALMIVLIQGGAGWSWASWPALTLLALFVIGLIVFLFREKKAAAPMMPLDIWKHRLIAFANAATLTSGIMMMGLNSFLPTYVQGVMGYSAIVAGFTLTAMSIGWPIASTTAGFLILRIGPRTASVCGGISLLIGSIFFILLDPSKGPVWAGAGSFFVGVGMGLTSTTFIVSIQNSVDWKKRGVATASNMFMRILGSSLGAVLLGGILNARLKGFLTEKGSKLAHSVSIDSANILLNNSQKSQYSHKTIEVLQHGLTIALHSVYWGVFAFAIITLILTIFLPKQKIVRR